jgi:hypothetical protein
MQKNYIFLHAGAETSRNVFDFFPEWDEAGREVRNYDSAILKWCLL